MHATSRSSEKTLLLFGPQIPRLVPARLTDLRKTILEGPKLEFLTSLMKDLPALWDGTIKSGCPELGRLECAKQQLEQLVAFFESENGGLPAVQPPYNLLLVPLTVIAQVAEYIGLGRKGPVQGFCVGFLAAAAVACARNRTELERWTATALRLAVCIGAIIDLDEHERSKEKPESPEYSSTWSVSWTSNEEREHLDKTLASFPQAYISCMTDADRVTLTIPGSHFADFSRKLADGGLSAHDIGLCGRYHTDSPERQEILQQLKLLCQQNEAFQFPPAEQLALPLRSTSDAKVVTEGALHEIALDCILVDLCCWYETVQAAVDAEDDQPVKLVSIGKGSGAIPRSFKLPPTAHESVTLNDYAPASQTSTPPVNGKMDLTVKGTLTSFMPTPATVLSPRTTEATMPIAVIGMACRYAQADSLEEFWSLINSGKNAATPVPADRFVSEELWRTPKGPFYGNFVKDNDAFDHRFFHMSAREAASMDPQQRLLLQVAYEAMESAGYPDGSEAPNRPVGCYVGAGYVEYEDNVASENATAFSATGTIRAFVSGRVSHYFGWTGPSVVFDTACSSSAVAIHNACKALQTNDCSVAIAGGVNMITSPTFYQNLAAASFLSPTGASKAFDADANGYCRGEGAGMLVLKPLSQAIADNDRILGTIVGSAVNQNLSCTPITVPDSSSQSDLYLQAIGRAGVLPSEVSYVEAHGTGTQVGDPIECASIRAAFGGPHRSQELVIGSVKDVVGHTEGASGVTGIIKTLLMMQHGTIPRQPNFTRLNPKIPALEPDRLAIATQARPWQDSVRRTALVNNYGAAGSNAAIVLQEYRSGSTARDELPKENIAEYPIFISAKTPESLRAYSAALRAFIDRSPSVKLGDVAWNLARKQNRTLECASTWTARGLASLRQDLDAIASGTHPVAQRKVDKKKVGTLPWPSPVVLCFGGQTGRSVYLSQDIAQSSALLRAHLDRCDDACLALGLSSLFPRIFDPAPIDDLVALHAMLFSVQYASARAWLDAGVQVASLVGHSFGQLTALCVAGTMDLTDGLRLVTGRARLMEKLWGPDLGVMLAIEGDAERLDGLLKSVAETGNVDVACYNSPRNIVLAGEVAAIDIMEKLCKTSPGLKIVRLANSHAYHSRLADPVLKGLQALADSITWREPSIPVETCSPIQSWTNVNADKIAQHTRDSVYFGDAVQRIARRNPSCVWLEAGSASPIIGMVRCALPASRGSDNDVLLSVDLGRNNPWLSLAKASAGLWASGSAANFWPFHGRQADRYRWLDLPPYQFAKTRHWVKYQPTRQQEVIKTPKPSAGPPELVRRLGDVDGEALFAVNPSHEFFDLSVSGHAVVGQSLCPAGLYFEMAIRAAKSLETAGNENSSKVPHIEKLHIHSPLGLKPSGSLFISLKQLANNNSTWSFSFFSCSADAGTRPAPSSQRTAHAGGTVALLEASVVTSRLQFVGRLLGSSRYDQVASSANANRLSGDVLYKVFARVVNYARCYKGVKNAIACNGEVVGDIAMPQDQAAERLSSSLSDPLAIDNFLQIAGIHVNCLLAEGGDDDVSVCNALGEVLWSEAFLQSNIQDKISESLGNRKWRVYSNMEPRAKNTTVHDVFVLDVKTGAVVLALLGAEFTQVSLTSLRRVLSKINTSTTSNTSAKTTSTLPPADNVFTNGANRQSPQAPNGTIQNHAPATVESLSATNGDSTSAPTGAASNVDKSIREMLSEVFGMTVDEVQPDSSLADLGVDSLMITEISSEIQKRFDVVLSIDDLQDLVTVEDLTKRLGGSSSAAPIPAAPPTQNGLASQNGVSNTNGAAYTNGNGAASTNGVTNGDSVTNSDANEDDEDEDDERGVATIGSDWLAANRNTFDTVVEDSGFANFRQSVYPSQAQLVVAYTVEALSDLSCDLRSLRVGEQIPKPEYLPKHQKLMDQMYRILEDAGLVLRDGPIITRTDKSVPQASAKELHDAIVQKFPQYVMEHELLRTTGARLADCLVGRADPLALMFGDAKARGLMADVYTNGPMFKAATKFLAGFLADVCERFRGKREIRILELGAGTGGTTSFLIKQLESITPGQKIRYTFSDISGSLVAAAKRKFANYSFMEYAVVNVEKDPAAQHRGQYDVIISTNCIHATSSLVRSCTNIRQMLREDGMLCLVEHTQNLFWFDLVWGLVEGWWLFDDGRTHPLASETRWKKDLETSGFRWVDWSDGLSEESKILRVIVASPTTQLSSPVIDVPGRELVPALETQETVVFKEVDSLQLNADIYYPSTLHADSKARPIALMIHGGGHVMLSRKDVRPKQTQLLLDVGFVPVSVDYRLCPETTLLEGPMTDVRDALGWVHNTLPSLSRKRPDVHINGDCVVAIGWSTGGTLALSLGWTAPSAGLRPPQAILVFYCPTDYEDECWSRENKPFGDAAMMTEAYNPWEAVAESPIASYNPPSAAKAAGGWMSKNDARSRIVLHMNWYGQTVPVLVHGLKNKAQNGVRDATLRLPPPAPEQVQAISPLAQIRQGNYRTPTFIIHPYGDDLIPWQQAQRTADELARQGVETELRLIDNAVHLFDLYPRYDGNADAARAISDGYGFLSRHAGVV